MSYETMRVVFAAVVVATVGCDDKPPPPTATTAASSTPAASSASAAGGEGEGRGQGEGKGEGSGQGQRGDDICPNTVRGALTKLEDSDKGVVMTITSKGASAVIVERVEALLERQKATADEAEAHSGTGKGGGLGSCPVVIKGTTLTMEKVEGGAKLTIESGKADEVDFLRREIKQRLARLEE